MGIEEGVNGITGNCFDSKNVTVPADYIVQFRPPLTGTLRIQNFDTRQWYTYNPKPDITPWEVAMLLPIFIGHHGLWDYWGAVVKYNLERHFDET